MVPTVNVDACATAARDRATAVRMMARMFARWESDDESEAVAVAVAVAG